MLRCFPATRGLMILLAVLCAETVCFSQNSQKLPQGADLLTLKLSPGKWIYDVQGDVRSIETQEYRLENRNGQMVETRVGGTKVSYFDRRGCETESTEASEGKIVWKYDATGRLAEMTIWLAGVELGREVYFYDLERRIVTTETYHYGSDKPSMREVAVFDERWNQTRRELVRSDEKGQLTQPEEVSVYNLTYDSRGRVIATSIADERGALRFRDTQEYDDGNRLIKSTYYEYERTTSKLISKSVGTYEKNGLLQTYSHYDARGQLLWREESTRELDGRGNWITERRVTSEYKEGEPERSFTLITRRKITFY